MHHIFRQDLDGWDNYIVLYSKEGHTYLFIVEPLGSIVHAQATYSQTRWALCRYGAAVYSNSTVSFLAGLSRIFGGGVAFL